MPCCDIVSAGPEIFVERKLFDGSCCGTAAEI